MPPGVQKPKNKLSFRGWVGKTMTQYFRFGIGRLKLLDAQDLDHMDQFMTKIPVCLAQSLANHVLKYPLKGLIHGPVDLDRKMTETVDCSGSEESLEKCSIRYTSKTLNSCDLNKVIRDRPHSRFTSSSSMKSCLQLPQSLHSKPDNINLHIS